MYVLYVYILIMTKPHLTMVHFDYNCILNI